MASITLTKPTGTGVILAKGIPITVGWTHVGVGNKIGLELWKGATKVKTIANAADATAWANTGSHAWTPDATLTSGTDYKLKIIGCVLGHCSSPFTWVSYTNPNTFEIATASVTVTYPSATGITLTKGTSYNITWTTTGIGEKIGCELLKGGTDVTNRILVIADGTASPWANTGSHAWTVPTDVAAIVDGTDYKIKIYGCKSKPCSYGGVTWAGDFSDNYFTISTTAVTKYKCTAGVCAEDTTGTYDSLTACESARKYAFVDGTCTTVCPDYSGTKYDTLADCTAAHPASETSNTLIYMIAIIAIIFIAIYFVFVS